MTLKEYHKAELAGKTNNEIDREFEARLDSLRSEKSEYLNSFSIQKGVSLKSLCALLFYGENHFQSLIFIWFILVILFFIESQIGYANFSILLLISYSVSITVLSLIGQDIIAASLPGMIFIITGMMAVLMPKARFRMFYMIVPVKPAYGTFEMPAIVTFPYWFILQIFFSLLYVLKALKPTFLIMIGNVSFLLSILCFFAGITAGFILRYLRINERIIQNQEKSIKSMGLNAKDTSALRAYEKGHYEIAAAALLDSFRQNRHIALFLPLVVSLKATGRKNILKDTVNAYLKELNDNEKFGYIEECYFDLRNEELVDIAEPDVLLILARTMFYKNKYEECKNILSLLLKEYPFSTFAYEALYFIFRNSVFPDAIDDIYSDYDNYAVKNNLEYMDKVREIYRP